MNLAGHLKLKCSRNIISRNLSTTTDAGKDNRNLQSWRKLFQDTKTKKALSEEDWYGFQPADILDKEGLNILHSQFDGSMSRALSTLFPETTWHPWKFKFQKVPRGFWNSNNHQRQFFEALGKDLGVTKLDDWYSLLSNKVVLQHGGRGLLTKYSNSSIRALMSSYPEHEWKPWMFQTSIKGYWTSKEAHKEFFDSLGKKLGVTELDDWYAVLSKKAIMDHGGVSLLKMHYGDSPIRALTSCYPEHNWMKWKFNVARYFWNSKENIVQFIAFLSEKLSIQTLDDWYRVDKEQVMQFGGRSTIRRYGGLLGFLREVYPHHSWDARRFASAGKGKKAQRWLVLTLQKIFPGEEILEDYRHPKALFHSTGRNIQLDVFIPSRSLAFEYQGRQHFEDIGYFQPSRIYQQRDQEKRALCADNNINLIEVPYWWNRKQESLQQMIHKTFPNLLKTTDTVKSIQ